MYTNTKPWRRSHHQSAARFYSVIFLLAAAFVANDITVIASYDLLAVGLVRDASIIQFLPVLGLILWIPCTQFWITSCRSVTGWLLRLTCLYLATLALGAFLWNYAFRNTGRIEILSMPEHAKVLQIERDTKLKLSWRGDGDGNYVIFDERNPSNESILREALAKQNIVMKNEE